MDRNELLQLVNQLGERLTTMGMLLELGKPAGPAELKRFQDAYDESVELFRRLRSRLTVSEGPS